MYYDQTEKTKTHKGIQRRGSQTDHSTGLFSGRSRTESWCKCYMLGRWKKESEHPEAEDESTAPNNSALLQAELKRLRKENNQLKLEREILKKAAAFFAKEQG